MGQRCSYMMAPLSSRVATRRIVPFPLPFVNAAKAENDLISEGNDSTTRPENILIGVGFLVCKSMITCSHRISPTATGGGVILAPGLNGLLSCRNEHFSPP